MERDKVDKESEIYKENRFQDCLHPLRKIVVSNPYHYLSLSLYHRSVEVPLELCVLEKPHNL